MLNTHHYGADGLWGCAPGVGPVRPRPLAHRAGVTAAAGQVVQALVLQLLGDECDHGRGRALRPHRRALGLRHVGLSGPRRRWVRVDAHCTSVSQMSDPSPKALPSFTSVFWQRDIITCDSRKSSQSLFRAENQLCKVLLPAPPDKAHPPKRTTHILSRKTQ